MTRADHRHRQTRELACLALGHEDGDADACPATDEELLADLVREVQRLRLAAGEVEETAADRAEQTGAIAEALNVAAETWATNVTVEAERVRDHLTGEGWRLIPAARP